MNEYDVFKNEVEAKDCNEMYGVGPWRSYFDGTLDSDFVKVLSLNRVLGKMDIRSLQGHQRRDEPSPKTVSKHRRSIRRRYCCL